MVKHKASSEPPDRYQGSQASDENDEGAEDKRADAVGRCGWGPLAPACLQGFATVWVFIVCLLAFSFVHGVQGSYTISMLTTLERRFNLPSSLSGMLAVMSTVGYAAGVIIVSHFGRSGHVPRMFSVCILMTSICGLIYAIPHFIYGTGNEDIEDTFTANPQNTSDLQGIPTQYCKASDKQLNSDSCGHNKSNENTGSQGPEVAMNVVAFSLFTTSEIIHGISGCSIWTVGIAFLDSNTNPELSSKLLGKSSSAFCALKS